MHPSYSGYSSYPPIPQPLPQSQVQSQTSYPPPLPINQYTSWPPPEQQINQYTSWPPPDPTTLQPIPYTYQPGWTPQAQPQAQPQAYPPPPPPPPPQRISQPSQAAYHDLPIPMGYIPTYQPTNMNGVNTEEEGMDLSSDSDLTSALKFIEGEKSLNHLVAHGGALSAWYTAASSGHVTGAYVKQLPSWLREAIAKQKAEAARAAATTTTKQAPTSPPTNYGDSDDEDEKKSNKKEDGKKKRPSYASSDDDSDDDSHHKKRKLNQSHTESRSREGSLNQGKSPSTRQVRFSDTIVSDDTSTGSGTNTPRFQRPRDSFDSPVETYPTKVTAKTSSSDSSSTPPPPPTTVAESTVESEGGAPLGLGAYGSDSDED